MEILDRDDAATARRRSSVEQLGASIAQVRTVEAALGIGIGKLHMARAEYDEAEHWLNESASIVDAATAVGSRPAVMRVWFRANPGYRIGY